MPADHIKRFVTFCRALLFSMQFDAGAARPGGILSRMANIDRHPSGNFCWAELATTDPTKAQPFYGSLFGWEARDTPAAPGQTYTIFDLQGRDTAALYQLRPDQIERGVPPNWTLYVAVDDADKTAARAAELGGTILAGPFDAAEYGRMSILQDPTGAILSIWQAKANIGIGIAGVDGTLCWADLNTPDRDTAIPFYSSLFGWHFDAGEGKDPSGYLHIKNGQEFIGGATPKEHLQPGSPPHWLPYFLTSNCSASTDRAKSLGAKIFVPPTEIEGAGRFAVLSDPQGAVFALFESSR
jgi:predicted enzyme related to lactoylglutathione lyase